MAEPYNNILDPYNPRKDNEKKRAGLNINLADFWIEAKVMGQKIYKLPVLNSL